MSGGSDPPYTGLGHSTLVIFNGPVNVHRAGAGRQAEDAGRVRDFKYPPAPAHCHFEHEREDTST